MTTPAIHTTDMRRQHVVTPAEIRPGDWLRDLDTLRQVESVDAIGVAEGPGMIYIIHFVAQPEVANKALGISSQRPEVTVWRELLCPRGDQP
jgi:hypothetical protein